MPVSRSWLLILWTAVVFWWLPPVVNAASHGDGTGEAIPAGEQKPPLQIALSLALSGPYAPMGHSQQRAFRLWQRDINAAGGILGRPVELTIVDDQSRPQRAREIYRKFLEEEPPDLFFAPFSSEITGEIMPLLEEQQYPLLASGAAADELWEQGYRYLFGIFTPAGKFTFSLLEMLTAHGVEELAVFYTEDPLSRSAAKGSLRWARWLGLQVELRQQYNPKQADYRELVENARRAGVEAVILAGHLHEAVVMRQAMVEVGWQPRVYYATQGPGNDTFVEKLGEAADGVFGTEQWQYLGGVAADRRSEEFVHNYQQQYGKLPDYFAFTAYSAGLILARAVEETGGLERPAIRDTLAGLDIQCITGRFRVDERGRQSRNFTLVTQRQDGRLEVVWPQKLMTAEPRL